GIRDWSVTGVQTCALPICQGWLNELKVDTGATAGLLADLARQKSVPPLTLVHLDTLTDADATAALQAPNLAGLSDAGCFGGMSQIGRASCRERGQTAAGDA